MGDRSAEMLNIMIAIIAVVALMALGFAVFTISKRMANSSQNDLVNQLSDISQSLYTDLDQQIITGARLKQVVKQANTTDCAILINTLSLSGATVNIGANGTASGNLSKSIDTKGEVTGSSTAFKTLGTNSTEASTNGQLETDGLPVSGENSPSRVPLVMAENYSIKTSLNTVVTAPLFVNYGSILKNGIHTQKDGAEGDVDAIYPVFTYNKTSKTWGFGAKGSVDSAQEVAGFGMPAEYAQTICYKNGAFITKLEYATNTQTSRILRYDSTADFDKTGKTMSIADTQQYNSYILSNAGGEYVGLCFIQIRQ